MAIRVHALCTLIHTLLKIRFNKITQYSINQTQFCQRVKQMLGIFYSFFFLIAFLSNRSLKKKKKTIKYEFDDSRHDAHEYTRSITVAQTTLYWISLVWVMFCNSNCSLFSYSSISLFNENEFTKGLKVKAFLCHTIFTQFKRRHYFFLSFFLNLSVTKEFEKYETYIEMSAWE